MKISKIKKYLILTFLLTYFCWGSILLGNRLDWSIFNIGSPFRMILYIIGGNGPPIIATIILLSDRETSWKEYVKDIFKVKQKLIYYVLAIGLASVYFIVPMLLGKVELLQSPLTSLPMLIPITILGGGLEEIGWRKVLQPELRKGFAFIPATLITAFVWSFWHLPLFFMKGVGQYGTNYGIFVITVVGLSFATGIVYEISKSIWLCILFHGMINWGLSVYKVDNTYVTAMIMCICLIVISVVVHVSSND